MIQERRLAGTKEFVHGVGPDEPLMMINNGRYYYHYDALGSVIALTNEEGQVVEGYAYDAYGVPTFVADGGDGVMEWGWGDEAVIPPRHWPSPVSGIGSLYGNPFLFTGQVYDPETSDYYYKARYYDPHNARFLSRDPIGTWTDPFNLGNAYAYVGNNPVTFTDPTGEFGWIVAAAVVGCAVGGGLSIWKQSRGGGDVDWGRAGAACAGGAIAGAVTATGVGIGLAAASTLGVSSAAGLALSGAFAGAVSGAAGGALGEWTNQSILIRNGRERCYDDGAIAAAAVGGAIGGAIGGSIAGAAFWWADDLYGAFSANFRTATSLRGLGGYSGTVGAPLWQQLGVAGGQEVGLHFLGAKLADYADPGRGPLCA